MAQPLPRTIQPPPELPNDPKTSDILSQYLRTFSLWCRHGFADKLSQTTAAPSLMMQTADVPPSVFQLAVTSAPTITLTPMSLGSGALGTPVPVGTMGVTDGSNAAAGQIGESITASGAATALVTSVYKNVTSISLTPGDWDVSGHLTVNSSVANGNFQGGITTTSNGAAQNFVLAGMSLTNLSLDVGPIRILNTAPTVVYLVGFCIFASGTATAGGNIRARRMR